MNRQRAVIPPSVKPGIARVERFPLTWRRVAFRELLEPAFRPVALERDRTYQLVVAKRNRGGIAPRERLRGDQIKTPTQFELRTDDFVIAKRQIIHGGCGFVPQELDGAIVSGKYDVFRPRPLLLPAFLRWFIHTSYFQQTTYQASIGVDVEKMIFQTDRWLRVPMPLPACAVQKRVAATLDSAQATEDTCSCAVGAKRRLKRALLQQLLTGKLRLRGFAGDWYSTRLGALGSITRGVSYDSSVDMRSAGDSSSVMLLRAGNLQEGTFTVDDAYFVDSDRCTARQRLRVGDVAICMSNGSRQLVGKASQVIRSFDRDTTVGAFCSIFRPNEKVDQLYIGQVFASPRYAAWMSRVLAGSAINNVRSDDVEALLVNLPKRQDEQQAIARMLRSLDEEIALLDRQLAALRKLKRGLMQKLLTGELEVPAASDDAERKVLA